MPPSDPLNVLGTPWSMFMRRSFTFLFLCVSISINPSIRRTLKGHPPDEDEADIATVDPDRAKAFQRIRPAGQSLEERLGGRASAEELDFLRACLALSPDERPSARSLLTSHPFLAAARLPEDDHLWKESVVLPLRDDVVHAPEEYCKALAGEAQLLEDAQREGGSSDSECSESGEET